MDAPQEKQYAMTTVLVKFIDDNGEAIGASEVAAAEAADIAPAYALLTAAVGGTPVNTKPVTEQATTARADLLAVLPALLGPLRSIATKTHDTALLAHATLSARQLDKMKPEELRDVSRDLFAAADARAAALAPYGLSKAVLAQMRGLHTAFAGTVRSTASLIDQRSEGNQSAEDLLADLMQQVYELDKPMEVFRFLNRPLYDAYKRARRVGSSGGKGSKGKGSKGKGKGGDQGPAGSPPQA
ncbi:hypothetical protein [Hymenobacter ruricola]|uniref:Uncharacterized protein n=1 Tax=Hymenobacter ruricola TaxID=2791023 RepID=A0ABS0IA93_9BACT|nr:hypothetical protein [Hymenobacter ruricola]MBF9223424.1 hypothetical protein [Hymenobacter ruricola]